MRRMMNMSGIHYTPPAVCNIYGVLCIALDRLRMADSDFQWLTIVSVLSNPCAVPGVRHALKNFQVQRRTSDQRCRKCIGDMKHTHSYVRRGVYLQRPGTLHYLRTPNSGNLQRELRAFVLLSKDQGAHHSSFGPLDLWMMVRGGDIELLDQGHKERLDLDNATQSQFSVSQGGSKDDKPTRIATRCSS